jgi:hypothetical protein
VSEAEPNTPRPQDEVSAIEQETDHLARTIDKAREAVHRARQADSMASPGAEFRPEPEPETPAEPEPETPTEPEPEPDKTAEDDAEDEADADDAAASSDTQPKVAHRRRPG